MIDEVNLSWIKRAKNKYFDDLARVLEYPLYLDNNGHELFVTVFGTTQGGKTTLILRLLGIKDELFEAVYKSIRAGSPEGSRATYCPTKYRISESDSYCIKVFDQSGKTREELVFSSQDATREFERINSRKVKMSEFMEISIPKCFIEHENSVRINMVDLPGWDGLQDNPNLLRQIYKTWIPKANCVLLVTKSEHLRQLDLLISDHYPEEVQSWKHWATKYRIVLTNYAESASEQKHWTENMPTTNDVYDHVISYLNSSNKGIHNCPDWLCDIDNKAVFVFDYGKSWSNLKDKPEYVSRIKPILDEYLELLKANVLLSTDEISNLRSDCNMSVAFSSYYNAIDKKIRDEICEYRKKIEVLTNKHENQLKYRKQIEECQEESKRQMEMLLSAKKSLESELGSKFVEYCFSSNCSEREDQIKVRWNEKRELIASKLRKMLELQNENTPDITNINKLEINKGTRSFLWWGKKADADSVIIERLNGKLSELRVRLSDYTNRTSSTIYDYENRCENCNKLKKIDNIIKKTDVRIKEVVTSIEKLELKLVNIDQDKNFAIKNAKNLPNNLANEYGRHKQKTLSEINNPPSCIIEDKIKKNMWRLCQLYYLYKGSKILQAIKGA